jgi:hypothetical protein
MSSYPPITTSSLNRHPRKNGDLAGVWFQTITNTTPLIFRWIPACAGMTWVTRGNDVGDTWK